MEQRKAHCNKSFFLIGDILLLRKANDNSLDDKKCIQITTYWVWISKKLELFCLLDEENSKSLSYIDAGTTFF